MRNKGAWDMAAKTVAHDAADAAHVIEAGRAAALDDENQDADLDLPLIHETRPIRFCGVAEISGWRIKLYTIAGIGDAVAQAYVKAAVEVARAKLPWPAHTADRYGVGFLIIHEAALFNQITLDWWERDNELRHRVFKADGFQPTAFRDITSTGEAFCVWELKVIGFECDAWVDKVLRMPSGDALNAYMDTHLDGEF